MNLNVEVISDEIVKPFSPTAGGLRHRLSFLDQLTPSHYNHLVYFYPKTCDTEADKITISDRLKHSVSNALTYFYPLAGRITEDQLFVDCNDEGIPFVEVRVKCQLSDVLNNLVPRELNKLLPFEVHSVNKVLAGIQLNVFDCGGIAIGVCVSHKIGDALSFFSFVKTWAAIARGETALTAPDFESASLFPPQDVSGFKQRIKLSNKEQIITKRFVFGAAEVEVIRRKYSENSNQTRPSRVEALSAFIWEHLITAKGAKSRLGTLFTITHLVNIRTKIDPPLPESSFGNIYSLALTILSSSDGNVVTGIRDSIKAVNSEYVKKLRDGYNHFDKLNELEARYGKDAIVPFAVTSLCRFPRYEADFGWGKPVWAGSGDLGIKNVATFMDTVNGDGIEAWITLDKEEMEKFGSDEGMLAHVNALKSF
ncbi:hypothetical protein like AT1G24430 [Hibiscus trionum]|uniref:Vinorine synthase-like n=1 Tax=Hibiscus trionum TaxID=183268 RepID=A0A9W7IPQ2_HIBTR|nr:hypothetical protein like AT1G24430 [Hibiscus trionum]